MQSRVYGKKCRSCGPAQPWLPTARHFPNHLLRSQDTAVTNLFPKCSEGTGWQGACKLVPFTVKAEKSHGYTASGCRGAPTRQTRVPESCQSPRGWWPCRHASPGCAWDSLQQAEVSTRGVPAQPPWTEAWVRPACLTRSPEGHSEGR